MWILCAFLSAIFAGLTAILSKIGVRNTDSDVATAIRTSVVLVLSAAVATITGQMGAFPNITWQSYLFLFLSGLATGASWTCYFKALSLGRAAEVSAVDKSSVVISVLLALAIFPSERNGWWIKLICLAAIAVGTVLTIDFQKIKESKGDKKASWLLFALLSAFFAAVTSILAKIGIEDVPSNLATFLRTIVVLFAAWGIVFGRKKTKLVAATPKKDLLFLVLSGVATASSWLCYYYAIAYGRVSVVVPIDKLSILFTVALSVFVLKEKIKLRGYIGLALIVAGTICMAVFA